MALKRELITSPKALLLTVSHSLGPKMELVKSPHKRESDSIFGASFQIVDLK